MSVRRLSPTANLLRNSRLFALPQPLPRPQHEVTTSAPFDSDSATLPYPTHAAIETSDQSLTRGDWGLKRPLPLRSTTRTSTPMIKIENVDSIDHITDFSSAADHGRTLEKWQELDMPLSVMLRERRASSYQPSPKSVFEADLDNTALSAGSVQERWKFKGPWIAGQDDGEFNEYLARKVKRRKGEFKEFLRQRLVRSRAATRRKELLESGEDPSSTEILGQETIIIPNEELEMYVKRLRKDADAMQRLLEEFLDLPREQSAKRLAIGRATYNDKGPPSTHPSAGLSYLRTASHTFNHPIHGPQEDKTPIQARVLKPQRKEGRAPKRAFIGVAGITVQDDREPFALGDDLPEVERFAPELVGGGKVWVQPKRADIDVKGQIKMGIKRAEKNAVSVLKADRGDFQAEGIPAAAMDTAKNRDVPDLVPSNPARSSNPQGYGLEDLGPSRNGRAKPFEGESDITALLGRALQTNKID